MNYIIAIVRRIIGYIKAIFTKVYYIKKFSCSNGQLISMCTRIIISKNSRIYFGKKIGTRKNVEFRASDGGVINIGDRCFFNNGCIVNSKQSICIGRHSQFGPNVMIFDHDHDFRVEGGLKSQVYRKSDIKIGSNVWVGANSVILRGTVIGDNCVIGAGSVISGRYEANKIIIQKKHTLEYNNEKGDNS